MINFDFILKKRKAVLFLLASLFLAEAFSFLSYYFSDLNLIFFTIIIASFLFLAVYNLEWALYVIFLELFSNSMGYVFYLEQGGLKLSLRIGLWLLVMAVFLARFLLDSIKNKKISLLNFTKIPNHRNYLYLLFFLISALFSGIIRNGFSDAFFDFNAWLYFALILPLAYFNFLSSDKFRNNIILIFMASVLFLAFKSFLLLFLFSHNIKPVIADLYYWMRQYYLGEITAMNGGFYRIFLQSQIYALIAFIVSISFLNFNNLKNKYLYLFLFSSISFSVLILSFSRSFWLGAVVVLFLLFLILWIKFGFGKMIKSITTTILSFIIGFLLVFLVIKFPWPNSTAEFDLSSLSERADIRTEESAVSSRWALLDVMKNDIFDNFLLGRGFGARLEYQSSDPRVLEKSADGIYSTYAFEWGWFDIWLKLGILGVLVYLFLLFVIMKDFWNNFVRSNNFIYLGLGLGLISLIIVNFFTPYLNHPLGIGFLILSSIFLLKQESKSS